MAYRKEKQRVLTGGLNLLPPADKLGSGESILMDNWRVDQAGQLRSRQATTQDEGPIGSGRFHSLTRGGSGGNQRYAGIGTTLYYGSPLSSVTGGFDGQKINIAFHRAAAWAMNRGKQIKLKSTSPGTARNWGIAAPGGVPTINPSGQVFTTFEDFEGTSLANTVTFRSYSDDTTRTAMTADVVNTAFSSDALATNLGRAIVTNGSTTITGTGTNWDATMIGKNFTAIGILGGFPAAYIGKITAVAGVTSLTVDTPMYLQTQGNLQYLITGYSSGAVFDTTHIFGSKSLALAIDTPGVWAVVSTPAASVDTRTSGVAQDDDVFRIYLNVDDPTQINSITVTLTDSSGQRRDANFLTPSFVSQTGLSIDASRVLSPKPNAWTLLEIGRTLDFDDWAARQSAADAAGDPTVSANVQAGLALDLLKPHFEIKGGTQPQLTSFDWQHVASMTLTVDVAGKCLIHVDGCMFVGVVLGPLEGAATYYVTFGNADGDESNPSTGVDVALHQHAAVFIAIPTSGDSQVTLRNIYRVGAGLTQPMLVGTINDNTTTIFTDAGSTQQAQNDGIVMRTDRSLPPAARGVIGPYFGRLIAYSTAAHPARYFWTEPGDPAAFPNANSDLAGNWEDAGGEDDEIYVTTDHKAALFFYKKKSIWRLLGDPQDNDPVKTNANFGAVGDSAVAAGGVYDHFVGPEGIYRFNGDFEVKVSPQLDPIFKGDYVQIASGEFLPPIDKGAALALCVLEQVNDRLYFSYAEQGQSSPNVTAILNLNDNTWSRMVLNGPAGGFTALHYEGAGNYLMGGVTSGSGYLYTLERGTGYYTDGGSAINVKWQSAYFDQGLPDNIKLYCDIEVDGQTSFLDAETPNTLTIYLVYDTGIKVNLGTFQAATRTTKVFLDTSAQSDGTNVGQRAKRAAIRIEGNISTGTVVINGVYLHWYPEERSGLAWDSGLLTTEQAQQVDHIEFAMTGSAQSITNKMAGDLPGNLLTQSGATPASFTAPNGRGLYRSRLSAVVEGRNLRFSLSNTTTPFQLHAARIRKRTIGEYIDGTTGEYWESAEFGVAPGKDGELKDFLLEYDATQVAALWLYENVAGSFAAVRGPISMPSGARQLYSFPLDDGAGAMPFGRVFKLRVVPPGNGIVRLHGRGVVRGRVYGVTFDGGAGERWQTQPLDLCGGVGLFREVQLIAQTAGSMTFEMLTEIPGEDLQVHGSYAFNTATLTAGREPVFFRLPGYVRGKLQQFRITGSAVTRLLDVKVWGRGLGNVATPWQWFTLPVENTTSAWHEIQVPIRKTDEDFTWVNLPVDAIE